MEQPVDAHQSSAQRDTSRRSERKFWLALLWAFFAAWGTSWLLVNMISGIQRVSEGGPVFDIKDLGTSFIFVLFWPVFLTITVVLGLSGHMLLEALRLRRWPP